VRRHWYKPGFWRWWWMYEASDSARVGAPLVLAVALIAGGFAAAYVLSGRAATEELMTRTVVQKVRVVRVTTTRDGGSRTAAGLVANTHRGTVAGSTVFRTITSPGGETTITVGGPVVTTEVTRDSAAARHVLTVGRVVTDRRTVTREQTVTASGGAVRRATTVTQPTTVLVTTTVPRTTTVFRASAPSPAAPVTTTVVRTTTAAPVTTTVVRTTSAGPVTTTVLRTTTAAPVTTTVLRTATETRTTTQTITQVLPVTTTVAVTATVVVTVPGRTVTVTTTSK
jgi:hypothetical protein